MRNPIMTTKRTTDKQDAEYTAIWDKEIYANDYCRC